LLSTRLLKLIKGLKAAPLIEKELIPIMEKTGEIITTERYYHLLYFTPIKVVDEEQSIFEETNMGPRPVKFVLNEYISKYDVMEIDNASVGENLETFIGGHIIGNSSFKEQVEAADLVGIKIVPLDEAFEHFRRDHSHFNITPVVKRPRPKLP
jgi:hypothetical protein